MAPYILYVIFRQFFDKIAFQTREPRKTFLCCLRPEDFHNISLLNQYIVDFAVLIADILCQTAAPDLIPADLRV